MLHRLANLGGEDLNNASAQFKTEVLQKGGVYDKITEVAGSVIKQCILPSTVFQFVAQFPRQFRLRMASSKDACIDFWRNLFSTPEGMEMKQLHRHLKNKTLAQLARTIPVRLHEDAGPFTKTKSMNVISWSSLLGRGSDLESKYQFHRVKRRVKLNWRRALLNDHEVFGVIIGRQRVFDVLSRYSYVDDTNLSSRLVKPLFDA